MNKKEMILNEAKRLFGTYGYLGFTLKQLAQACVMTSPALYYFYSSKADLFRDCLLSELEGRRGGLEQCARDSETLEEFAHALAYEAIDRCGMHNFRAGNAMAEIIHLPEAMQEELRAAWDHLLIEPVERMLARVLPTPPPGISPRLLANFMINIATFTAAKQEEYTPEALEALAVTFAQGVCASAEATKAGA